MFDVFLLFIPYVVETLCTLSKYVSTEEIWAPVFAMTSSKEASKRFFSYNILERGQRTHLFRCSLLTIMIITMPSVCLATLNIKRGRQCLFKGTSELFQAQSNIQTISAQKTEHWSQLSGKSTDNPFITSWSREFLNSQNYQSLLCKLYWASSLNANCF